MSNAYAVVNWFPILQRLCVFLSLRFIGHWLPTPLAATPWLSRSRSSSSRSSWAILRTVAALTPAIFASSSALTPDFMTRTERSLAYKAGRNSDRSVMGEAG